ncbi:MAG: flagellar basal-body rod protein FlgF [Bdellovibrionales bacterium]
MQGASLVLGSYQESLETAMAVIANNVANVNTTGFKRETIDFDSFLSKPTPQDSFLFAVEDGTYRDTSQGAVSLTGNPLDIAVQGHAYLAVQTKAGTRYTRAGAFQVSQEGELVTARGERVLDDGGQSITFPTDARNILISGDGKISAETGAAGTIAEIGKLGLYEFQHESAMEKIGLNLYASAEAPSQSETSKVVQGAVESSNVSGVEEMTRMIEVSRAYQRIANLVHAEHERQVSAIQRLGKISN